MASSFSGALLVIDIAYNLHSGLVIPSINFTHNENEIKGCTMSNPAYMWLTDENGSPMTGSSLVSGRIGAIELKSLTHNVNIPADSNTGRLTGTRIHAPIMFQKEFDRVTPLLYKALTTGVTLKSAMIKMFMINEAGVEIEYFNILLENVKITSITPDLYPGVGSGTHLETVLLRYESITWKHCEGNIVYKDSWNHRVVA